jgi:hypothetical protein
VFNFHTVDPDPFVARWRSRAPLGDGKKMTIFITRRRNKIVKPVMGNCRFYRGSCHFYRNESFMLYQRTSISLSADLRRLKLNFPHMRFYVVEDRGSLYRKYAEVQPRQSRRSD